MAPLADLTADRQVPLPLGIVADLGLAPGKLSIHALEALLGDEVDHAGHRVGAPGCRGAAGDDFGSLDHVGRDQVQVEDTAGGRGHEAGAVDQGEGAAVA